MAIEISKQFKRIAAELRDELRKIDRLYAEWRGVDPDTSTHSLILRGKASIFHDFYCGVERLFQRIANEINGGVPAGEFWHRELLNDMKLDLPGLRPPVISEETHKLLSDFLSFRHKFRNIYGFDLDFEKVAEVEAKFPEAHKKFKDDLETFLGFMDTLIAGPSPSKE
jgi:hypothetical protein